MRCGSKTACTQRPKLSGLRMCRCGICCYCCIKTRYHKTSWMPRPQIPEGFADPPVWDALRAVNWVSTHELLAHWDGRPCRRMDSGRALSSPATEGC